MRFPFLLASGAALALIGCGGSPTTPATDAGADTSMPAADADDEASCFPTCAGDGSQAGDDAGGDASTTCSQLKATYEMLQTQAQACNPQLPNQCASAGDGPCCPVTVNGGNVQAVADFGQAVVTYTSQCDAGCGLGMPCPTVPSNQCVEDPGSPAMGQCTP